MGIDSVDGLVNAFAEYIWEPVIVKKNALIAATEVIIKVFKLNRLPVLFCQLMRQ